MIVLAIATIAALVLVVACDTGSDRGANDE